MKRALGLLRWCVEIAGVAVVAGAAALWWLPLGVGVVGVYLIVLANSGDSNSGDGNSGDGNSSGRAGGER